MSLTVTILGCGSSGGVPRVGSGWGACDPSNPKNRRRRCSVLVERTGPDGKTCVLVDTSPDLREQLLAADVKHLEAVLYTHDHADHTHGIDDLRPLVVYLRRRIPVWADAATSRTLHGRFGYCFATPPGSDYPPILTEQRIEVGHSIAIDGPGGQITALPFEMMHGPAHALGFRFANLAYASDVSAMPEQSWPTLADLDVLILDALRYTPHPTHLSLSEALALIERVRPRRAILTNLHSDLDHGVLLRELPQGVEPAFDGLRIELSDSAAVNERA